MDSTDVEVYGPGKQGVAFNYRGQRAGRPHLATWAEAGITVAAELLAGNDDVRPRAADMLRRAVTAIPAAVTGRPRLRADSGYFTADLAHAADELGCDYAVAAKRNTALWRAYAAIPEDAWVDAKDMPAAQVTAIDYAPAGWPDDTYTIVRRVRIDAKDISTDPRARRRRTISADQLTLALDGGLDQVGGQLHRHQHPVLPAGRRRRGRGVGSAAHRHRGPHPRRQTRRGVAAPALRTRGSQSGVWMRAALLACNLSVLLQAFTGLDTAGRAHGERLRRELLHIPARVIRHARRLELRLPPGPQILPEVLARLRALPTAA